MTKQKTRQYEMLMRVQDFGSTHQPLFPAGSLGAQALTELAESVAEITRQAVARQGAVGEGRHTRRESRTALTRTIHKIRRTSRLLAVDDPLAGDSFPRWDSHKSDRALLETARSYATDAAPLAERFIGHGMPATFLTDLQAEIDAFARALDRRQQGRMTSGEAHSRIRAAIGRGQWAARRLDAYLANTLEHDDPVLVAWTGIRRIGPDARSRRSAAATPTTGSPVRPTTPTATTPTVTTAPTATTGPTATTVPLNPAEAPGASASAAPLVTDVIGEVIGKEEAA